jgi:hypothetical protein
MSTVMWELKEIHSIRELATEALERGFLSLDAENRLREMLKKKYELEDLRAFMCLQKAAMSGTVQQESRLCHMARSIN